MTFDPDYLYNLLPALYRLRDAAISRTLTGTDDQGPLRILLDGIANQIGVLEENLEQLYDDQFIETCAEWVIPYLGDLIGARGITVFPDAPFSARSQVANTIAYRRRKGTASSLEQIAHDVTGWDAAVVEFFERLATTQYMNHLRPQNQSMVSVRNAAALERLNTPFDLLPRTADVRRIEPRRGQYNLPNIGIFLWRIGSYALTDAPACRIDDRRYTFDALGRSLALYNRPVSEADISHLADPSNIPHPFTRRELERDLIYHYGPDLGLLIWKGSKPIFPVLPESPDKLMPAHDPRLVKELKKLVCVCDLSNIKDLNGQDVLDTTGQPVGWVNMPTTDKVAIDPVLGRIAFPALSPPVSPNVRVTYHYGFSANLGGGEYDRESSFDPNTQVSVVHVSSQTLNGIQDAIGRLEATGGIIELTDSGYYNETPVIRVGPGKQLDIRGADGKRPILRLAGPLLLTGQPQSTCTLNGLLIAGGPVTVPLLDGQGKTNGLATFRLSHCTLPPTADVQLTVAVSGCDLYLSDSIVGKIQVIETARLEATNCLIDAGQSTNVAITGLQTPGNTFDPNQPAAPLILDNCTIIGKVYTRLMERASNTLFQAACLLPDVWPAPVLADRRQEGCVRFCYLPSGSRLPRPYRCQPQRADDAVRIQPLFTSLRFGEPGYGQLSLRCPVEIRRGADNEAEIGVFNRLYQPQREANLQTSLADYLRFGLEAGIFFES